MKYRVFTKKGCGSCRSVIAILKQKQVDYSEIDVSTEDGLNLAFELGVTHSGTVIDENDNIIPLEDLSRVLVMNKSCEACTV